MFILTSTNKFWAFQDEQGINQNIYIKSPETKDFYRNNINDAQYMLDYLNPNITSYLKDKISRLPIYKKAKKSKDDIADDTLLDQVNYFTLYGSEPAIECDETCMKITQFKNPISLPTKIGDFPLNENTLPLETHLHGKENNIMLNLHNLYSLYETKFTYKALTELGVKRPFFFTRSGFLGSQQYSGKWLGHFSGWKGLEMAIRNTMKFNVQSLIILLNNSF